MATPSDKLADSLDAVRELQDRSGVAIRPWTVVPLQRRDAYMGALEEASVRQDIAPIADFLAQLVDEGQRGRAVAETPPA